MAINVTVGDGQTKTETGGGAFNVDVDALATGKVIFSGANTFDVDATVNALSNITMEATNGATLDLTGLTVGVGDTTNFVISGASTIKFGAAITALGATTVTFQGTGGTLDLSNANLGLLSGQTIAGFAAGDNIDFGLAYNPNESVVYTPGVGNSGTLTLYSAGGTAESVINLTGAYDQNDFMLTQGANGDAVLAFNCFLAGTRIMTPAGEVMVERLRAGDLVTTLADGAVPIVSLTRTVVTDAEAAKMQPVMIGAGALGDGLPERNLYVSPDHGMYIDGALVPAQLLVNGRTIYQMPQKGVLHYYHVEVEPHGIIFAEGAASESFLDIGREVAPAGVLRLVPSGPSKTWEDACAPLLLSGPQLNRIKARLEALTDAVEKAA